MVDEEKRKKYGEIEERMREGLKNECMIELKGKKIEKKERRKREELGD